LIASSTFWTSIGHNPDIYLHTRTPPTSWSKILTTLIIMVATRRASARLRKQDNSVDTSMEEQHDVKNEETETGAVEEEVAAEASKNDINCKKCVEEKAIETHEVETEYDKPDKTREYLAGFVKRVFICTMFVMLAKTAWPHLAPIVMPEAPVKDGKLYVLTDRSFRGHVNRGEHFIMMYAPWCGHCQRLKPDWEKLAKNPGVDNVFISKVDCTANKVICSKYDVKGYPTLLYFRNGELLDTYDGAKTLEALKSYLKTKKDASTTSSKPKPKTKPKKKTKPKREL